MPIINFQNCNKPVPKIQPVQQEHLNAALVIEQFLQLWQLTFPEDCSPEKIVLLRKHLNEHIGPLSTLAVKQELIQNISFILEVFEGKYETLQLNPTQKSMLLTEIETQITACSAGFLNRVQSLTSKLFIANSLDKLLEKTRNKLVDDVARSMTTEIHTHNAIFKIVQAMGINIDIPLADDPYGPQEPIHTPHVQAKIKEKFEREYLFSLQFIKNLIETIKAEFHFYYEYNGREEEGFKSGKYEKLSSFFETLFQTVPNPEKASALSRYMKIHYSEDGLPVVTDINWSMVTCDLFELLYQNQSIEEETPGEREFTKHYFSNDAITSLNGLPPDILKDVGRLTLFLKLGDMNNLEAQFTLLDLSMPHLENPIKRLNLSAKLIAYFNCDEYSRTFYELNQKYDIASHLIPYLEEILFKNSEENALHAIITILSWCNPDIQKSAFSQNYKNQDTLLLRLANLNKPKAISKALEILETLPPQTIKDSLLCPNAMGLNFLNTCVRKKSSLIATIFNFYEIHGCINKAVLMEIGPDGFNLMMDIIQHTPDILSRVLPHLKVLDKVEVDALCLHKNTNQENLLNLAIKIPEISDQIFELLSQRPQAILSFCLANPTQTEPNSLMHCLKNHPNQLAGVLKLVNKLDGSHQLHLLGQVDNKACNVFHLANLMQDDSFDSLVSMLANFDSQNVFAILNQPNDLGRNILLQTASVSPDKLVILIKHLKVRHVKVLHHCLFEQPGIFGDLFSQAIKSSSTGACCLIDELATLHPDKQQVIIEHPCSSGKPLLEGIHLDGDQIQTLIEYALSTGGFNLLPAIGYTLNRLVILQGTLYCQVLVSILERQPSYFEPMVMHVSQLLAFCASHDTEQTNVLIQWMSTLSAPQLTKLMCNVHHPLLHSIRGTFFNQIFDLCQARLEKDDFDTIVKQSDVHNKFHLLIGAMESQSEETIARVLSLDESILVDLLSSTVDHQPLLFYISDKYEPHSKLVLKRFLAFSEANKKAVIKCTREHDICGVIQHSSPLHEQLLELIINTCALGTYQLDDEDLQYAFRLPHHVFKILFEQLSDEKFKAILRWSNDNFIFEKLNTPAQTPYPGENVALFLQRLNAVASHQDELKMVIKAECFWDLSVSNLTDKTQVLKQFVQLLSDQSDKTLLFTTSDDDENNVFMLTMLANQSIEPALLSFLSYTPNPNTIYEVLEKANKFQPCNNILLRCAESKNLQDLRSLLKVIMHLFNDEEVYNLLSCSTQRDHINIFQQILKFMPEFMPKLCSTLSLRPSLRDLLLTDLRRNDLQDIDNVPKASVFALFNLFRQTNDSVLESILFEERELNLLEICLYNAKHQKLAIDFIQDCSDEVVYKIFDSSLITYASENPINIFKRVLALLNRFGNHTKALLLERSDSLFDMNEVDNLIYLLNYLESIAPQFRYQVLRLFDWIKILNKSEEYRSSFFQWLSTKSLDYQGMILAYDALTDAAYINHKPTIERVLQTVLKLPPQVQTDLFRSFNEGVTFKYDFKDSQQAAIEFIRSHQPEAETKKRNFVLFQPMPASKSSETNKKPKPNPK